MSNLTADLNFPDVSDSRRNYWPRRLTNALQVFKGSALGLNPSTGLLVKWADTAGLRWMGFAQKGATGNTSATPPVEAELVEGATIKRLTVTGVTAITDMDAKVYLSTDNPDDVTLTPTTNVKAVGQIVRYHGGTTCDVRFYTPAEYLLQVLIADITDLTDSTGKSGTHDDTIAQVADIALSTSDTYTDAAVNAAVNAAISTINQNLSDIVQKIKELVAALNPNQ